MSTPTPPQFDTPEGELTTHLIKTTSIRKQELTGEVESNTVDIEINVNGAGFESNPDLVSFEDGSFQIPNPNVLPEGLELGFGLNTIEIRSIHQTGRVSDASKAEITVESETNIDTVVNVPSGLRVRRHEDEVELVWTENDNDDVIGYHVYASDEAGGGQQGYRRVNGTMIKSPSFQEEETIQITESDVHYTTEDGILHQTLVEEEPDGTELQTVSDAFLNTDQSLDNIRVRTDVESFEQNDMYSFTHQREGESDNTINSEFFASVPDDEPLYYVITAVAIDAGQEIESPFSEELIGLPLTINTNITNLPRRKKIDVSEDYVSSIFDDDGSLSLIPGSVSRDLFVDPFSSESERLYFLADFIRRSQTFPTLLQIDDNPAYKDALQSALGFGDDVSIQALIDDAFDRLAANVNVTRQDDIAAIGDVVFYTNNEPETDLVVPEGTLVSTANTGGPTITFRTTSREVLPEDDKSSYFNINRERWELTVRVEALEEGEQGNVSAGTITNVVGGGASGMQVENLEAMQFGRDEESNQRLAERAMLAFASVDSGTRQGYLSETIQQSGVRHANVVASDDDLMERDFDPLRERHIGGKVDIWIQGEDQVSKQDTFTLEFDVIENVEFYLDAQPDELIFATDHPDIIPSNPITRLLGETSREKQKGYEFINLNSGNVYDLKEHEVLDYNRIQLNTSINQPSVNANDIVSGDVRLIQSTDHVMIHQPVDAVNTVQSDDTDETLTQGDHFDFLQTNDPLLDGRSSEANDKIRINQERNIPSPETFTVNDETHVLTGETRKTLDHVGVLNSTIRVFDSDRSNEYDGSSADTPDFFIEEGSRTSAPSMYRNPEGSIDNGEEVSVDYQYDENFEVDYTINHLLDDVSRHIDQMRHITADVLIKEVLAHGILLEMTVVLKAGTSQSQADSAIKTRVSQTINALGPGDPLHQSDVIEAVEQVDGVSHVVLPITTMTHDDGNLIVREPLSSVGTFIDETQESRVYLLKDELNYHTSSNGGPDTRHRGVFQNGHRLDFVGKVDDLRDQSGRAMIIGSDGLVIEGFTDENTLDNQGFDGPQEREQERNNLTANHVLVSVPIDRTTADFDYEVSYITQGNRSNRSTIETSAISHIELSNISITYTTQ